MFSNSGEDRQTPIYDEIDAIYDSQSQGQNSDNVNLNDFRRQAESGINPVSRKLYEISESIAKARKNHLETNFFTHEVAENNFIKAVAKGLFHRDITSRRLEPLTQDVLKRKESAIGATLFGPRPSNERLEFFNDNRESWFFYQCITDSNGTSRAVTFHYEVRPEGIMRVSNDEKMDCKYIQGYEFNNFISATQMYHDHVMTRIYNCDVSDDKKLQ